MTEPRTPGAVTGYGRPGAPMHREPANLADILERVLDKGIVIAGDIQVNLLDIELLTIKLRLVIASVDRAKEMGIDWWEHDPTLSSRRREIEEENQRLRDRLTALEAAQEPDRPDVEQGETGPGVEQGRTRPGVERGETGPGVERRGSRPSAGRGAHEETGPGVEHSRPSAGRGARGETRAGRGAREEERRG